MAEAPPFTMPVLGLTPPVMPQPAVFYDMYGKFDAVRYQQAMDSYNTALGSYQAAQAQAYNSQVGGGVTLEQARLGTG